jgi:hypothetical protein
VRQARLVGLNGAGQIALDTSNIKDAVIKLVDDSGESWEIVVAEVSGMAYWAPPAGSVITYRLRVRAPPNSGYQDHDLCSSPPAPGSWPGNMYHAILFEGDRYRPVEKIVSAIGPATAGWFNIACAGSVPAKLHLARHTESSANPAKWPSQAQRQAMLRAYAAAVCWGKDSYTAKGELLNIFDRNDVMTGQIDFNKIEGLWDATHAICLGEAPVGEQRLVHANSMLQADANQLLQQMKLDCPGIPSCSTIPNLATTWKQIGMVLTTNP